ncbi:class I SAM-dependent methyltransferase [Pseudomonas solani]|uniref:Class I SAM-dependent methyltransferase n=1 Tax=Pseudomonas solani TaxID=2731552 RepID=A0AAU7Y8T7_9PSED
MTCPQPLIRLAPITTGLVLRNPRVLLSGPHQPTMLGYLDGWPKRWAGPRNLLIQFALDAGSLQRYAADSFDMAVVQAPPRDEVALMVRELVRVSRQGLITLR